MDILHLNIDSNSTSKSNDVTEEFASKINARLRLPSNTEFVDMCASYAQYSGKPINICFLSKPHDSNRFYRVIYDGAYAMNFASFDELKRTMIRFMYADMFGMMRQ